MSWSLGEGEVPEKDLEIDLTKRAWKLGSFGYLVAWSTEPLSSCAEG
ncbi:hypothetical protein [Streptomyces hydrogenans]